MDDIKLIKSLKNKSLYYIENGFPYKDNLFDSDRYDLIVGDGVGDLYYIGDIYKGEVRNGVSTGYFVTIWWNMESGKKDSSHYELEDFMELLNFGRFILTDQYGQTFFDDL